MAIHKITQLDGLERFETTTPTSSYPPNQQGDQQRQLDIIGQRDLNFASYSGCDISVLAYSDGRLKKFAELLTISYSTHREKYPVRVLGKTNPKGFTRGSRTIAGSMIFATFDRTALWEILSHNPRDLPDHKGMTPLVDQIPPIDVTITFQNEFGYTSVIRIYGIEIVDSGMTASIDDMITEQVVSYIARDMSEMSPPGGEHGPEGNLFNRNSVFFNGYPADVEIQRYYGTLRSIWKLQQQLYADPTNEGLKSKIESLKRSINTEMTNGYSRLAGVDEYGNYRDDYNAGGGPWNPGWTYSDIR